MHIPNSLKYIYKDKKGCKTIYKLLSKSKIYPSSLEKWKRDLHNQTDQGFFEKIQFYEIVFSQTKDPKLIWMQYRINHRILGTNYLLKKMNIVDNDKCSFCKDHTETLTHLFYDCEVTKHFWHNLSNHIKRKCNVNFPDWSMTDILFGNIRLDLFINRILLYGKQHIYYCRVKGIRPEIMNFIKFMESNIKIEKYVAKMQSLEKNFEKYYKKYENFVHGN